MTAVYITKYALTKGIQECTVNEKWSSNCNDDCIYVDWPNGLNEVAIFRNGEWWEAREDAVAMANQMKREKIASLQKQIAKLGKKTFA